MGTKKLTAFELYIKESTKLIHLYKQKRITWTEYEINLKELQDSIKELEKEQILSEDSEPTFKAGDEVEGSFDSKFFTDEYYFYTGGKNSRGYYICEGATKNGALYAFPIIRKLDPDKKYKDAAKEMMTKEGIGDIGGYTHVGITPGKIESMLIEALKKGKES